MRGFVRAAERGILPGRCATSSARSRHGSCQRSSLNYTTSCSRAPHPRTRRWPATVLLLSDACEHHRSPRGAVKMLG